MFHTPIFIIYIYLIPPRRKSLTIIELISKGYPDVKVVFYGGEPFMTDRELLELIAKQVGKLTKDVDEIKATMATKQELAELKATMATKQELAEVKSEVNSIKDVVIRIENDHGQKLSTLFNGYKQNAERLDRVEAKLSEHEEMILKKL